MGYIKKLKNNELVGGTDKHTIYPVTSTEAVFEEITNGNESSFKSQKTINKEQQDELDDHEERIQAAEAEDIKSITINGSTKEFRVDGRNNVDLTIYTVDNDPEMPSIASNVEDLRNMVGTSTPVLDTSHKTRIETLEGGESVTGSVENKIKTKVDSINSSYQDDNNEYVKYSMTQVSGKVTDFNIDETSLKNAITSLNTSISGDNIIVGPRPATGLPGKIYRVVNSSNNTYTDYMYSNGSWIQLAIHDTSDGQAQVAYYTCIAAGSGAQTTKQFVGSGSLTYTPSSGGHIKILMGEANTATGTIYLQFGTTTNTKKPLYYNGEPASASNTWEAGETIAVYYDPSANSNAGAYFASNAQGGGGKAEKIKYDNSQSGLAAENVQGALDEVSSKTNVTESQTLLSTLFTWTSNKFISGTGDLGTPLGDEKASGSASSYSSGYLDISGYSKIEITLPRFGDATSSPGACFYDENHVAISGMWKAGETPANTMGTYTFAVPANAKYIRATKRTDFGIFKCVGYTEDAVNDKTVQLISEVDDAYANDTINLAGLFTWPQNKKQVAGRENNLGTTYTGDVVVSSRTTCYASDDVDISGYDYIRITLPQFENSGAVQGACFYDANHIPVMGLCTIDETPEGMVEHTFKVPSNAKFLRATNRTDLGNFTCLGFKKVPVSEVIEGHGTLENEITSLFGWSGSKFISQTDGSTAPSGSSDSHASSKVIVSDYDRLRLMLPVINTQQANAGWAFYDNDGVFILGNAMIDTDAQSSYMVEKTLNIPSAARYFAMTWRKDNGSSFYCYGIKNAKDDYEGISNAVMLYKDDMVNAKDYGCIGDGVADDTNALKYALASGKRKIYIPAGTYNVGQTLQIPAGTEFYGDGIGKTVLNFLKNSNSYGAQTDNPYIAYQWRTFNIYPLINATGQGIYIHDFEVTASDVVNNSYRYIGLSLYGAIDARVNDVKVTGLNFVLSRDPSVQFEYAYNFFIWGNSTRVVVDHCISDNAGYENIGTEDVTDVTISNGYWGTGWRTSLQIHRGSKRVKVIGNTINNNNTTSAHASLTVHGISTNSIDDLFISNNTILSTTNESLGLRGGIQFEQIGFQNVSIIGNTFQGNSYAIVDHLTDGESASFPNNIIIVDNVIHNTRYGICLKRGNNYIIKDNVVNTVDTAIELKATRYICKDNILVDNTTKTLSGTEWVDS